MLRKKTRPTGRIFQMESMQCSQAAKFNVAKVYEAECFQRSHFIPLILGKRFYRWVLGIFFALRRTQMRGIRSRCLDPQTPPEKAFRGSKHLLTRYLGDFGRLGNRMIFYHLEWLRYFEDSANSTPPKEIRQMVVFHKWGTPPPVDTPVSH